MGLLDSVFSLGTSAVGWARQREGGTEEGTPISPLVSSSFLPVLDLSFPSPVGPGQETPPKVSSQQKASLVWLSYFCFMSPGETSQETTQPLYLTQAVWCKKWTFALHVCDVVLLNCFLSKVRISQCQTFLANEKTLNKYTWRKGSMLIVQTGCQVVCLTSVF